MVSSQGVDRARLGRAVRVLRVERGYSQEGFGHAAGLHRNYVGAVERGEINPTFRVLVKLARGLEVPLSGLLMVYEAMSDPARRGSRG